MALTLPSFGLRARLLLIIILSFLPLSIYVFYTSYLAKQEKAKDLQERLILILQNATKDTDKPISDIQRSLVNSNLPKEKIILFFDESGKILSYSPDSQYLGGNVSDDPSLGKILQSDLSMGASEGVDFEGNETLFAYSTFLQQSGQKTFLVVGVPKELVEAAVNKRLYLALIILAVAAFFSLGATWIVSDVFILRPVRKLVVTANTLRQGNLGARTQLSYNLGALGQLAQTFDQMAQALQEYTGQLEVKVAQRTKELEDANFGVAEEKGEIEKQYKLMQVLIENLPVGVFMVRMPSGEAFMANQKGYEVLGIGPEEQHKRNLLTATYSFLKGDGTPYPIELLPLNITLKEGRAETKSDVFIKKSDGKLAALKISSSPVKDNSGKMIAALMLFEERI